jgi:hypothetical protein
MHDQQANPLHQIPDSGSPLLDKGALPGSDLAPPTRFLYRDSFLSLDGRRDSHSTSEVDPLSPWPDNRLLEH